MTDCNGETIGVGDVVEVVKPSPSMDDTGAADLVGTEDGQLLVYSHRLWHGESEWMGWYAHSELRLVRRKEKA